VARVGAGAHLELAEARCSRVLRARLAIHDRCNTVGDVCCYILLECSIWPQARGCVGESEQRVHLTHDFHNLCMSVSNRNVLARELSLPGTNLEELVNCLCDTFAVHGRVRQVD
jgi:hypothetical protein